MKCAVGVKWAEIQNEKASLDELRKMGTMKISSEPGTESETEAVGVAAIVWPISNLIHF